MATVTFFGAAQEVTGSCHRLESPALGTVLLDCGMHQGGDAVERLHQEAFEFDPGSIDGVILSHAHLDHSGLLPKLVHEGFRNPIYCTAATRDLLEIMLEDSVGLYERDLERENLRRARRGKKPIKARYGRKDVERALRLCVPIEYGQARQIGEQATLIFHDAGHILGSAIVELRLRETGKEKTLVFSGDLGKTDSTLMSPPATLEKADLLLMESTYGDRDHRAMEDTLTELKEVLRDTWQEGGNVMIPAFAVGRTQELLFHLGCLYQQGELDNWQIYLDSPMAIKVTAVYSRWLSQLDDDVLKALRAEGKKTLETFLPPLTLSITPEESMAINKIKRGAIIIAGSGMCTGGRIRHHFKQRIWNQRNTIIFCGFQARGTLGRLLVDGVKHIRMFNEEYAVKARIETLGGFSAHAGQSELLTWVKQFAADTRVVLVHGEPRAMDVLSEKLWQQQRRPAETPRPGQSAMF
ncbi:MAG: MBL fold metallo-hydrolase [Halioglobus sp.]